MLLQTLGWKRDGNVQVGRGCEHPEGGVPANSRGWNEMILRVPSDPNHPLVI